MKVNKKSYIIAFPFIHDYLSDTVSINITDIEALMTQDAKVIKSIMVSKAHDVLLYVIEIII